MQAHELFQELKQKIRRGEISGKLPSIAELTSYYHISHNTVKKVLDMLKMQQLVYGVQGKGVYVRNFVKQKNNPDKVAICCDLQTLYNAFYLRMLNMLRQKAAAENFTVDLITNAENIDTSDYRICFIAKGNRAADVLSLASRLAPAKICGINLEHFLPEKEYIYGCRNDNFAGGYMAMEHFYRRGHRCTGVFSFGLDLPENIFFERLRGAEKFVSEHPEMRLYNWNIPAQIIFHSNDFISQKLAEHPEVTGIFAFTDVIAMRVLNCLSEHKRSVPDDVSVIGYDNSDFSGLLNPALTTIEEDAEVMAETVCCIIKDHLAGKEIKKDIFIKPELVERASVKNIKPINP